MAEEKKIEQPSVDLQELLDSVLHDEPTEFVFRGKKHKLGWLRKGTMSRCSHIRTKEKNEWKRNVKICVCILLNNIWKIRFLYWIYWRWLYYIKDVDIADVLRVLDVSKKKIPSNAFSLATILATGMTDVMMTMTRSEAKAIQAEQAGEQPSHQLRSSVSSFSASTSSQHTTTGGDIHQHRLTSWLQTSLLSSIQRQRRKAVRRITPRRRWMTSTIGGWRKRRKREVLSARK